MFNGCFLVILIRRTCLPIIKRTPTLAARCLPIAPNFVYFIARMGKGQLLDLVAQAVGGM